MSAEVGVHWRPIVSSCNSPSGTPNASATSLPPLPDLIPIKKSQKCYDRLFKTENSACHIETSCSSSCSGSSTATSLCGNVSSGETPSSVKQAGSNERASVWSSVTKTSTADCYEFVDELEFDDFNDGISTTNTPLATLNSTRNTKTKCNSGGKKRQAYNQFVPLYTGNSNNCNGIGARTNTKASAKDEVFVLKQERGETSEVSDSLLSDDVKKEKHRRSRRNNTHTQQQNTFTSADTVHPIDYPDTDVFDADESKSRDVSSRIDNSSNCTVSALYDDANDLIDDDGYENGNANHYTNEMHTKAIRAVNKNKAQQKHRKTGRRKQTKKRKPVRQSKTNSIKKTQQFTYQSNKFNNCRNNNNNNSLSVPRVNPIFLWVKQDDTTIVEVRCEDYDKRNRIRLTKTSNGWKAIPRTEKSFLLPPSNLEHLHRSDEGSTSNVVDTEEETRKKVHKKHKRKKKKKHKKERVDSVDSTREQTDTTTTTETELKVPPIIVNIKQEAVEKRAHTTKRIDESEESKAIKVEALEPREPAVHNGTYDEARSFPEEFDNIEAHIPSHTISLAAINKDRYVHAHVSHNNNNNNDFISELGFNHQESQENTCIEKPIPNDISSAYHHRIVEASCGGNSESMSMSNTNSIIGASPTPILIPSPPLVSNIEHEHEHETPSASLFSQASTLENTRVRNVVACSTQTMAHMESSISSVPVARMEMHSNGDGGENRKVHSQSLQLPNNNNSICETRLLDESGAVCNNIQQQQGVLRGTKDASTTSSISNMCPDSAPPTAVYETLKREVAECIENTEHLLSENNKENVLHFPENKHLSDYPDCSELINEINAATHDLMSQHCDNTMTGAELIDSLIEQRCEDNHISGTDDDVKNSIYTISDDYNEEDDLLLNQAPVSDILSRLNETLSSAPKCLSFNEAGEIEGLHGDLFDTAHNPLNTMEDNMANPFSQNTGLDDLSLTIKNLTNNSDSEFSDSRKESDSSKDCNNSNQSITILSADSGEEEIPKDLTCKKQENEASASTVNQKKSVSHSPRPVSHSSDTIQSPQPSGLPAVPPSPELFPSNNNNNNNKNQSNSNSTKLFIESILASPKRTSSEAQQKEPLNLGKCRKSASPTVSCSEEIKKSHAMEPVVISDDEPSKKRMKKETKDKEVIDVDKLPNPETARLLELLTSGNDPDPLTQFRLLISNPAWKVPDPLLVPKDRLNAVLASPAREIPLLLTTRPELRLPEAFAFPAILQDPDILVISLTQLERILHNQDELLKAKAKASEKEGDAKKPIESPKNSSVPKSDNPVETPENANDMTAAMSMFNQMLWLPYLQQMGQFNPEMIKRMMGLQAPSMPDMLSLMSQNRFNDFSMPNPMDYKRQIEAAMWQEAMANDANLQRAMKIKADSQKKAHEAKASATSKSQENARTLAAAQAQSKLSQMMNPLNPLAGMPPFMQPTLANQRFFQQQQAAQLRNQLTSQQAASQLQAAYNASAYNKQSVNSHHANSRSQPSPNQKKASTNSLLNQNPFLQVPNNFQEFHEQQQQLARRLQKEKDHHLKQQQQQQIQQDSKPRVTCKSLSNLMQPPRNATQADLAMFGHANMSKMSNLMAMPGINMHPGASSSSSNQSASSSHSQHNHHHSQQTHHHQQQAKLKVKPGLSLLDPAALQRRLLSNEDDITGGAVNLEESPDMASPLWHPLFGNQQKSSYNSPWNWTTVTASGE
ncbi:probable serine/threonine-protein kinase DDB_G0282963 [Culicoides brevitarsis]|uniref:probable serine/threonine-protein kinase DDB_G0282963 n=1 Tax=Culicoides brevitarsis TaxID=469753 RepID=UPI00307C261A